MNIGTIQEALEREKDLELSSTCAEESIRELFEKSESSLTALSALKFDAVGRDPLNAGRPLNLIEQLNQTFTYLASFRAVAILLHEHPECAPLILNLGARAGTDIESRDGKLAAEVFAAVDPRNNNKLNKDVKRIARHSADIKYVFYLSPVQAPPSDFLDRGVKVRWLRLNSRCSGHRLAAPLNFDVGS